MEFLSDDGTVVPDEAAAVGADTATGKMLKGDGCKMSTVSDQTAVPSEAEESDQEPESLADVDTKSHASSAGTMKGLPIIMKASTMKAPVGKMARCFLCRRNADDLSLWSKRVQPTSGGASCRGAITTRSATPPA